MAALHLSAIVPATALMFEWIRRLFDPAADDPDDEPSPTRRQKTVTEPSRNFVLVLSEKNTSLTGSYVETVLDVWYRITTNVYVVGPFAGLDGARAALGIDQGNDDRYIFFSYDGYCGRHDPRLWERLEALAFRALSRSWMPR